MSGSPGDSAVAVDWGLASEVDVPGVEVHGRYVPAPPAGEHEGDNGDEKNDCSKPFRNRQNTQTSVLGRKQLHLGPKLKEILA